MLLSIIKRKSNKITPEPITDVRNYTLSDFLPSNFLESDLGLDSQVARDDAWVIIQNLLNESNSTTQVNLFWNKKVAITNSLRLGSNTNIVFEENKGVVMKNGCGYALFKNRTHKPYYNANIVDNNISISGKGIVNGNAVNIPRGVSGQGMAAGFAWHGVRNLSIKDIKLYNHKMYAQIATNVVNGFVKNVESSIGNKYHSNNMDGWHWDGWCRNCEFDNLTIKAWDDSIGVNCDDGYTKWHLYRLNAGMLDDFYDINFNGPSRDIRIKNIVFNNENSERGYGVRILSVLSRIDNINISNIRGTCKDYAVLIDTYQWSSEQEMDYSGIGNIGAINCDDVDVLVVNNGNPVRAPKAVFSVTCSTDKLIATNVLNRGSLPIITKSAKDSQGRILEYGGIKVNGIDY